MECWRHFVLACRLLCQPSVTVEKVKLADALLLQFCRRTERIYGKEVITPNMHMNCHLCECVNDFGPLHSFWLFACERFNGILGMLPNNNRSIEVQMTKRFLSDQASLSITLPMEYRDDFEDYLPIEMRQLGSLGETYASSSEESDFERNDPWAIDSHASCNFVLPRNYSRYVLDSTQQQYLQ